MSDSQPSKGYFIAWLPEMLECEADKVRYQEAVDDHLWRDTGPRPIKETNDESRDN